MTINKQELNDSHLLHHYEETLREMSNLLHEDIAQKMYAVFNHLQYIHQRLRDNQDRTTNQEMIKLTKRTIEEIRFLSQDIRPFFQKGLNGELENFITNYRKKLGIIAHIQSLGEKYYLPQIVELTVYRSFKDVLNMIADVSTVKSLEVTTKWDKMLELLINYQIEEQIDEKANSLSSLLQVVGKQLQVIDGSIDRTKINANNDQISITIPNVRWKD